MRSPWSAWVDAANAPMDPRPLALTRVLLGAILLVDLLQVAWIGLVPDVFLGAADGGLTAFHDKHWLGQGWVDPMLAGPGAWALTCVGAALIAAGVGTRPALLVTVAAFAQLGHAYPPGDRGIDRLIRTVFLLLVFASPGALGPVWRRAVGTVRAWPTHLLRWLLAIVYMSAGFAKILPDPKMWLWPDDGANVTLYRILTYPITGHLDPEAAQPWMAWFVAGQYATIVFEVGAFLLLTPLRAVWLLMGVAMHLGIALWMDLGIFPWAMLALYPALLPGVSVRVLDAVHARGVRLPPFLRPAVTPGA